jgi:hypothetical protein
MWQFAGTPHLIVAWRHTDRDEIRVFRAFGPGPRFARAPPQLDMVGDPSQARSFLELTSHLGTIRVREVGDSGAIFVIVQSSIEDANLDAIRVLAKQHWPGHAVVIGRRSTAETPPWLFRRPEESGPVVIGAAEDERRSKAS